jgi:hypothetical protein
MVVVVLSPGMAGANPCAPGAVVDYPLTEVLNDEASGYHVEAIIRGPVDGSAEVYGYADQYPKVLAERSAALPPALADLPYLIVLGAQVEFADPLQMLTYTPESTVLPQVVAALDRQGLTEAAKAAQVPLEVFPGWDGGLSKRLEEARTSGSGWPDGARGILMRVAADALHRMAPEIQAATLDLLASDPKVAAEYEVLRVAVKDDRRVQYLIEQLMVQCMGNWGWTPTEMDAAFARLAPPQRDLMLMHLFLSESFNGSTHQYFFNSSGTMAPQLAETLDRLGLPDHAAGVREGMAIFPAPYPRDTDARRDVMADFTEVEDEALYQLTIWADDGLILDAMNRLARDAGVMPR